ncbi:nucleoside triphosphate pyrophosphohydrolase [Spiribacter vilamensis]|uniref:ATP diphosphatase n=1 Tax=Spiribacter vilamensis TaxID=531306 RepID=A0A4Q8CZX9_9GAMM|nr:nucleoside triphosphate pyrophosphohydrolase [Spiribacter vilamensis]RZU98500.1 ATP diphosphatase [Spiribacter vilamensis]
MTAVEELLAVMARLRDPERGCPWDRAQDFRSIVPHTLEEAYEVADAIERDDHPAMRDELGDLLFQVVFYAQIGREAGSFDFEAIARAVTDKLIRRHPHVFGDREETTAGSQRATWEAIKAEERAERASGDAAPSALDDVPLALPALTRSRKLQSRAARVGFDWPEPGQVIDKLREELGELEEALGDSPRDPAHVHEEMGDLLLACVNLSRQIGVDPEQALRDGNAKFERRFRGLEAIIANTGQDLESVGFDRLEAAYQQAKARDQGIDPT